MKKTLSVLLVLAALMSIVLVPAGAYYPTVDVYVNGVEIDAYQPAIIVNGRTMVPLRAICEALKCDVSWDPDTRTAQIQNEITIIAVQIDNYILSKVDREDPERIEHVELDVPPIIYNNSTLVPARAISEALFAIVDWDGAARRVDITLEFDYVWWFDNHGIAVASKDGKIGFINESRETVIPFVYEEGYLNDDDSGLAIVNKDGKWGIIDVLNGGKAVVPFKYDWIYDIVLDENNNLIGFTASMGDKYGYVNKNGKVLIPYEYEFIHYCDSKSAIIYNDGGFGVVSTSNKVVVPFVYEGFIVPEESGWDGKAWFVKDDLLGLIDCRTGEELFPFICDAVEDIGYPGVTAACINGMWGVIDEDSKTTLVDFVYPDSASACEAFLNS